MTKKLAQTKKSGKKFIVFTHFNIRETKVTCKIFFGPKIGILQIKYAIFWSKNKNFTTKIHKKYPDVLYSRLSLMRAFETLSFIRKFSGPFKMSLSLVRKLSGPFDRIYGRIDCNHFSLRKPRNIPTTQ
jgi:hypothetical protein